MKRLASFVLALMLIVGTTGSVSAEMQIMRADEFFNTYTILLSKNGTGGFKATFSVSATETMYSLGLNSYDVQQKINGVWTTVAWSLPGSLGMSTISHSCSKTYSGTSGEEYRVYACFYAQKSSGAAEYAYKYSGSIKVD